jgi:hypothetical protein
MPSPPPPPPPPLSKTKAKAQATRLERKRRKETARLKHQATIEAHGLSIPSRLHMTLLEAKRGGKKEERLPHKQWAAITDLPMETVPHSSGITHAGILNPNFVEGHDIPKFAAIRIAGAVSDAEGKTLETLVQELKEVRQPWLAMLFLADGTRPSLNSKPAKPMAYHSFKAGLASGGAWATPLKCLKKGEKVMMMFRKS